ncbi:MAG: alpha/beta hydrolase [Thiobacillus sp.]
MKFFKREPKTFKRVLSYLGALLITPLLAACSPFPVLNGLGSDSTYRQLSTLRYGDAPRQQLDVYQPAIANKGIVIVFFYGGGWRTGQRDEYRFVAQTLTRYGATVVIPDYRTYPTGVFPDFMYDAAAAVAWTQKNIAQYGGDPKKIYLVGHSAGAHIATLLALDKQYLATQGIGSLAGVVGLATPANFAATLEAKYRPAFGNQTELERAQPIRYVRGDAPPMLLLHGADDGVVSPRNSLALAERITELGGQARAKIYPDKGHPGLILFFAPLLGGSVILDDTLEFLGLKSGSQ